MKKVIEYLGYVSLGLTIALMLLYGAMLEGDRQMKLEHQYLIEQGY